MKKFISLLSVILIPFLGFYFLSPSANALAFISLLTGFAGIACYNYFLTHKKA